MSFRTIRRATARPDILVRALLECRIRVAQYSSRLYNCAHFDVDPNCSNAETDLADSSPAELTNWHRYSSRWWDCWFCISAMLLATTRAWVCAAEIYCDRFDSERSATKSVPESISHFRSQYPRYLQWNRIISSASKIKFQRNSPILTNLMPSPSIAFKATVAFSK